MAVPGAEEGGQCRSDGLVYHPSAFFVALCPFDRLILFTRGVSCTSSCRLVVLYDQGIPVRRITTLLTGSWCVHNCDLTILIYSYLKARSHSFIRCIFLLLATERRQSVPVTDLDKAGFFPETSATEQSLIPGKDQDVTGAPVVSSISCPWFDDSDQVVMYPRM
jgi:hypothetical protein